MIQNIKEFQRSLTEKKKKNLIQNFTWKLQMTQNKVQEIRHLFWTIK